MKPSIETFLGAEKLSCLFATGWANKTNKDEMETSWKTDLVAALQVRA